MGVNEHVLHSMHPYVVIVTMSPGPNAIQVYGIKNTETGVVEAYIAQLAKAKFYCEMYADELKYGTEEERAAADFVKKLQKEFKDEGGKGGGLN